MEDMVFPLLGVPLNHPFRQDFPIHFGVPPFPGIPHMEDAFISSGHLLQAACSMSLAWVSAGPKAWADREEKWRSQTHQCRTRNISDFLLLHSVSNFVLTCPHKIFRVT